MNRSLGYWMVMAAVLVAATGGCQSGPPNPELTVQQFWRAVRSGDQAAAASYTTSDVQVDLLKSSLLGPADGKDAFSEQVKQALLARINITTTGHKITGDTATVDVEVVWPDLRVVISKVIADALPAAFAAAFSGKPASDTEALLTPIFLNALKEAPDITTPHQVSLILVDGAWKIAASPLPDPFQGFAFPGVPGLGATPTPAATR